MFKNTTALTIYGKDIVSLCQPTIKEQKGVTIKFPDELATQWLEILPLSR